MKALPIAALVFAMAPAMAATCGEHLGAKARRLVDSEGMTLAYAGQPSPIPLDRHFKLAVAVCGVQATGLRVDADMPAHRHGMNYRASVQAVGEGRFEAEGLLFHMPGRWRLIFDVDTGGKTVRLTQELDVR